MRRHSVKAVATSLGFVTWLFASLPAAAQSWPMFQGNPGHTGYLPVAVEPGQFHVRWSRDLAGGTGLPVNPVAAGSGMVFASVSRAGGSVPQLFALRTDDGTTAWTRSFGDVFSVNPPSFEGGRVYLQTCNHGSDTWLWAIDGSSGTTAFKAPHEAQWEHYYAPTLYNGRVYVNGGYYGGMLSFSGGTGERYWFTPLPQYDGWTPAVDGARAFAYVGSYAPGLYVRKLLDGTDATPAFIPDPDFEWDGWSMDLAPVIAPGGRILAIHNGRLIAFNPTAGVIEWQIRDGFTGQPSVDGGRIYAANNGGLDVYDASSRVFLWSWTSPTGRITRPMIVTSTHVFVSTKTAVWAVDLSTHEALWSFPAPNGSLAIADGTLFVAAGDGTLTAISLTSNVRPTSIFPTTGPSIGGTPVTITGTGFQQGATVLLGGNAATVVSVTPTVIQAITPPHPPGPFDVEVVNPDREAGRILSGFTYTCGGPPPGAAVLGGGEICSGGAAVVEAVLAGTPPFALVWSDGFTQSNVTASRVARTVSPAATTVYSVVTVSDASCAAAGTGGATVTVTPTPSAAITAPGAVCVGAPTTASVPSGGIGATYAWTISGGTIVSGAGTSQIVFTAAAAGSVTLGVTVTSRGCSATSGTVIFAALPPTAAVSGGGTICSGESASVRLDLAGTPPWNVTWSDGLQQAYATSPVLRSVSPPAQTTYTVVSVTDAVCTGTAAGTATVGVNPTPSTAISAPSEVCPGSTGNAASIPATPGATYGWTVTNGVITEGAGTNAIRFTAGASGSVTLGVTASTGLCSGSSSLPVPVHTPPTAVVGGGGAVCAGSPATIHAALTGTPPFRITWSDGVTQTAGASPATRTVSPAAATTYTITALSDAVCSGSATGGAAFAVNVPPTAEVAGVSTICPGDAAVVTVALTGAPPISLLWSDGELTTGLAPGTVARTVRPTVTTLYTVATVSDVNCSAGGGGGALVTLAPDPAAVHITAPDSVCSGRAGSRAEVPDAGTTAAYRWTIVNGTITSGAGTRAITFAAGPSGPVELSVTLQVASGCSITGTRTVAVKPTPSTPAIDAPPAANAEEKGLSASVAVHAGSTYAWSITNGSIASGQGTGRIVFSAGQPGVTTLTVVEGSAEGCRSEPATHALTVAGITTSAMVPVVLDAAGAGGARYSTELTLVNPDRVPASVELAYTAASSLGATGSGTVRETLAPGRQLVIPDTIRYLRDRGLAIPAAGSSRGDGPSQGGSLAVTFRNVPPGSAAAASARITAPSGPGRAGLSCPSTRMERLSSPSVHLFGLRHTAADRSNVALLNAGAGTPITLRVTLRSGVAGDPRSLVLPDVTLAPGQWTQLNSVLEPAGFANGWARVDRVAGTEPFLAYAVFNDNATNDGSYVPAVSVDRPAGPQLLPVLVESGGFASELVLANPGARKADVTLSLVESLARPAGDYCGAVTESLQPGEQRIIPDALDYLRSRGVSPGPRGSASYAGALSVSFAVEGAPAPGFVGARTAAPAAGGGQYGVFYTGSSPGEMSAGGAFVFGLVQDASSRTNLAVVNGAFNMGPVTVRYSVYDGTTGAKVGDSAPLTLGPGAWRQVNAVLSAWGVSNGYVRVERLEGAAPILVYAVVNDGGTPSSGTSDGTYVPMSSPPR